ncbi:MAG: efflux system transcriptional repressor MexL [Rhodothalassiaceae bacterium]
MARAALQERRRARTPASRASRGRPRSADKARAILKAASDLFLSTGFDRTSMDEVARAAQVSKQTVYAHFTNKEKLFRSVIAHKVSEYFTDDPLALVDARSLSETLNRIGRQYVRLILSDEAVAMFRLLVGHAETHPKMVRLFYEEGPERLGAAIEHCLADSVARGTLGTHDVGRMRRLFETLLRGELYVTRTLGLLGPVGDADIDAHVATAVADFLKLFATGAAN